MTPSLILQEMNTPQDDKCIPDVVNNWKWW